MKFLNLRLLILFIGLITASGYSQDFDLRWSQKMEYTNGENGYFTSFIGSNDKYVYSLFNNLSVSKKTSKNQRIDIIAYDKETMKEVEVLKLKDSKDDLRSDLLKGKEYLKTVILDDVVYVFWEESIDGLSNVYAEVFSTSLDKSISMKRVFSVTYPEIKKRLWARNPIVILSGKAWNNDVLVGTEIHQGQGEAIDFEYVVFDSKLAEQTKAKIELPIAQLSKKSAGLTSYYKYGKDGNLYIQSYITLTKEQREDLEKGEQSSYSKLSVVNIETAELISTDIRFDNKNIIDFAFEIEDDGVRLYGFYSDMDIDPKGYRTSGIFYTKIAKGASVVDAPVFTLFSEELLAELFKNDAEDKQATSGFKKKRKKNEDVDKVSLNNAFGIESVLILENGNAVLFCSKMNNYSVTTCTTSSTGGQTCTTRYYCTKSNVTAFELNPEGQMVWSKNIDRSITYSGWDIYDLRVLQKGNKAYVMYGSAYDVDAEKKNRKSRKKGSELRDKLEYVVFELDSGESEKKELVINTPEVEKVDRKYVSPLSVTILDDEYYISSKRVTFRPGLTIAGCAASVVCFPVIYFVLLSPSFRKGEGYLGKIDIIE